MTYDHAAPLVRPQVGGFYTLRAGLRAFINGETTICGLHHWKGLVLDPAPAVILWYDTGAYSPVPHAKHELDIVAETSY